MAEATERLNIVITAQDQASAVVKNIGNEVGTLFRSVAGGLAGGAGFALFNQIAQGAQQAFRVATDAVIGFNATLEQSRIAWATMLGGAAQANAMLAQLQAFAATTPFEFPDVERAGRRMLAMGFAVNQIIPLLTDVGNATAALGLGNEGIDRITLALGQMSTRTKVSAQDMLQLTEVGVPAWRILAEATGQSVAQVQDAAEKGSISSDTFIQAFRRFSQANYGGLMERQSQTFSGAVSNIADSTRLVISSAFEPLFGVLRDLTVQFANFTQSQGFRDFGNSIRNAQIAVGVFLQTVSQSGPILQVFQGALAGVATVLGVQLVVAAARATAAMLPLVGAFIVANAPLIALATVAAAAGVVVAANWEQISNATAGMTQNVATLLGDLVSWIGGTALPTLTTFWTQEFEGLVFVAVAAFNALGQAWNSFWSQFASDQAPAVGALNEGWASVWSTFVDIESAALRRALQMWNDFIGVLTDIRNAVPSAIPLGTIDALAGKFADVDRITTGFKETLAGLPQAAGGGMSAIGTFFHDILPPAIERAANLVQTAGGNLADLPQRILQQIQQATGIPEAMGDLGKQAGTAFGNGVVGTVKPLLEELARMLAQARAAPVTAALEDTQAAIERDRLLLQIRGLPVEARAQARREIRELTRNVVPPQQLAAFDVTRDVTLAQRAESAANLRNQILQTQLALAGQGGGAVGGSGIVAGSAGPTALAPQAVPPPIQIPLQVNIIENGQVVQTFEQLLEANAQAQMPPVVQVSAVRRN